MVLSFVLYYDLFKDMQKSETHIPVSERNIGSGRPRGSYIIKDDVIQAVKDFLAYAGFNF